MRNFFSYQFFWKKKKNKRNVAVFQNKMCTQHVVPLELTSSAFSLPCIAQNTTTKPRGSLALPQWCRTVSCDYYYYSLLSNTYFCLLTFGWQQQVLNVASTEAAPTDFMTLKPLERQTFAWLWGRGGWDIFRLLDFFKKKKMIGGQVIIEQVNQTRKTEEENRKWGGVGGGSVERDFFFFCLSCY